MKTNRTLILLVLPAALVVGWLVFGDGLFTTQADARKTGNASAESNLQQAARSIAAAGKDRVATASSDDEALMRAQMSLQAIELVGALGDVDTTPQADELFESLQTGPRRAIVDPLIQTRLATAIRQWNQLNDTQHSLALQQFVAAVKKSRLTPGQAELLLRIADFPMFVDTPSGKMLGKAIKDLVPLARRSDDAQLKRMADICEGTARRLDLPGKPLEINGTLFDGEKLDWSAYRGKVVLVDFHASWCGPCREEVPNILENYRAYHDKGFEVVGVNLDKDKRGAQSYFQQTGFHFPTVVATDPAAASWDLPIARYYGIVGIPRVILVDQQGKVVSTSARGDRLGRLLEQLLGPSGQPRSRATSRNEDAADQPAGELPAKPGEVIQTSAEEAAPLVPEETLAPDAPEPPK
jgi:thiol-disulfide isomerase/thioredoxin